MIRYKKVFLVHEAFQFLFKPATFDSMQMIAIEQRNQNINIKQGPHQMPSSSRSLLISSLPTTLPREGKGRKPYVAEGSLALLAVVPADGVKACRTRLEITRPAVVPPRRASPLATMSTSSSISRVVRRG